MSEFDITYESDADRLVITRLDLHPAGRVDDFVSPRGLLVRTDVKCTELFRVEIPRFSRHADFLDVYRMFGPDLVRTLLDLQNTLQEKQWSVSVEVNPLRSKDLVLDLVPA